MARCLNCIHCDVCDIDRHEKEHLYGDCSDFLNDTDVVPKSEVERLYYNLQVVLEERAETKQEVAREIFKEMQSCLVMRHWHGHDILSFEFDAVKYSELKKKYVTDTNVPTKVSSGDICVVCGEHVPEGRQICSMCETGKEFFKKRRE